MCLETLLMQPGIVADNVLVAVDEKFSEPLALIDLFGFKGEKTSSSSTYMGTKKKKSIEWNDIFSLSRLEHYEKALNKIWELHPTKVNRKKSIVFNEFIDHC